MQLGMETLLTWEVTLGCYQELVCFHNQPQLSGMLDYPPLMVHTWDPYLSKDVWSLLFPQVQEPASLGSA